MKTLRVKIATKNEYLKRKLELELSEGEFLLVDEREDFLLLDLDTEPKRAGAVTMSYERPADIALPFRLGEIRHRLSASREVALSILESERSVLLFGEKIKLTELEFSLFSLLFLRRGYVSREEILDTVWGSEADGGIINVYVHYLREKLERGGEKIILSSRKEGYRINEKYLGGCENA